MDAWEVFAGGGTLYPRDLELPPAPAAPVPAVDRAHDGAADLAARLSADLEAVVLIHAGQPMSAARDSLSEQTERNSGEVGTNKRYADAMDRRAAELSQQTLMRIPPCTIPMQAYGPQPLEWAEHRPTVWAWVSWPHKPAERLPAVAHGWNDRVVVVYWMSDAGELNTVVWRNAVSRRRV